ncbi:MAG: MFS transporter [Nitratireductor sp.]|nr:MFS transporter [Nitratireductor sp.]
MRRAIQQFHQQSGASDLIGVFAAIASISSVGIALGLAFPLLSLILESRGFSASIIGANAAIAGLSGMAAVWLVTPFARRFGVTGTMLIASLVTAASFIAFYLFESIWIWFLLRIFFHGALSLTFVMSEFWITAATTEQRRGMMLGVYATMLSIGFGIGPGILALTGSAGILPFLIGTAILLLACLPALAARGRAPALSGLGHSPSGFIKYIWVVPLATGAVVAFGAIEQSILPLIPVYGSRLGFDEAGAALLLLVIAAGNVALQIPLGMLSDRARDRRQVLYGCALVGMIGSLTLPLAIGGGPGGFWPTAILYAHLFIWGGVISGLYTVGLAHLGSRLSGGQLAEANSAFVFCYGIGAIFGPQLAGYGMEAVPPHGFAWVVALLFALYLVLCVYRAFTRPR